MTVRFRTILIVLLALCSAVPATAQDISSSDGAAALGVALRRLGTTKRVLMIAAHPDDENTALIAELALGAGADVAYLSLTRGEGGQNLIGPELQEGLGIIRTEELLAARRVDGARQFFTRAYDYGYSKSADEAFRQWPHDTILGDVVEIIRRFRPDIIIPVFSGTPADGHGQHQASGILAREAFTVAADPARFPQHMQRGLRPHQARTIMQALYRPTANAPLRVSTGDLDPLFGRSHYQLAMQSRSRHRSQDMGNAEPLGPQATMLTIVAGAFPVGATSIFAGADSTPSMHARTAGVDAASVALLTQYETAVATLRASFNPLLADDLVTPLIEAVRLIDNAAARIPDSARYADVRRIIRSESEQTRNALRLAAGIVVDVVADTPTPVPGQPFTLTVSVWNGGTRAIRSNDLRVLAPGKATSRVGHPFEIRPNTVWRSTWTVDLSADARRSEPYFLRAPRAAAYYRWEVADSLRGEPFEPADVRVVVDLDVGADVSIEREAEFVEVDKSIGELRRPLLIVPALSVIVDPRVAVITTGNTRPLDISVTVASARNTGIKGTVALQAPGNDAWQVGPLPVVAFEGEGTFTSAFKAIPPATAQGLNTLTAVAASSPRDVARDGYVTIRYPHIRPRNLYSPAVVKVSSIPVRIADNLRVGYIEGAGDGGAQALAQMGAIVTKLDAAALATGDLSRYDAIVAGIRAYEVRPDVIAHNERLLEYTRNGGTFVVQYNKYEIIQGGFMPFPATIASPHGRVTDENAPVILLAPDHRALTWPNRITAADFTGWTQERGLYFLDTFDPQYTPLLAMSDAGEDALRGALVTARVGKGWYVYTGLALFRQLPEGVPGAYRLLANLVSLGRSSITP